MEEDFSLLSLRDENEDESYPVSDADFAEKLQLQEALEASLKSASSTTQVVGESSQSFCGICMEGKERHEMFRNKSCSHSFCSDCIGNHVTSKFGQGNVNIIACPGVNCKALLDPDACRSIIPEDMVARWEEGRSESTIPASQKYYCPYKTCSGMLVNDNNEEVIRESECPICRRLFCARCHVPWHSGIECEEFQRLNEDERGTEDLMVRVLARDQHWMKCPDCNYLVDKTEGCIHVTCRCGVEFCYVCGSIWSEAHWGCQLPQS